jgi:hypothetical protein
MADEHGESSGYGPNTQSTNSSLSSSERFGLNMRDKRSILVYRHPTALTTSSESDLCKELDKDPNLRVNKVPIPWGNSHVELQQRDLFPPEDRESLKQWPTMKLNLANITLPRSFQFKRMLNLYKDLYVVSPERSPTSSPESSQQISPNSTFRPSVDGLDAPPRTGAERRN